MHVYDIMWVQRSFDLKYIAPQHKKYVHRYCIFFFFILHQLCLAPESQARTTETSNGCAVSSVEQQHIT